MERTDELKRIQDEGVALEEQAGLTKAMERAREGRFIPIGAFGEEASPDEYFADEYDYFREQARDAYFSVQDLALRIKLIAARRKADKYVRQQFEADIVAAKRAVSIATARTRNQPWTKAAVIAVGAVAVGYGLFGLVGAIAGAVGGFYLGQGVISEARNDAATDLEQAKQELERAQQDGLQRSLWPECFSLSESTTGEREERLDVESAYANVVRAGKLG